MKKTSLWIGAGALVVLCAAYMGVTAYMDSADKKKEAADEAAQIYMTDMPDTAAVTEVTYKNSTEEFSFKKEGDIWYYEGDHDFPVKQSAIADITDAASKLPATRKLEGGDNLSQYGLDAPASMVTLTKEDKTGVTILIGSQAEGGDYYAQVQGEDTAYTIGSQLPGYLDKGLYDIIQLEEFPAIEGTNVQQITITKGDEIYHYEKKAVDDEGNIAWYEGSSADENNKMDDNSKGNTLADAVSGLYVQSCVNYKAGDEDLSQYGLDQPNAELWFQYEENGETKDMKLYIGSLDKDSTYYYTRKEGSMAVNQISKDEVDKCLKVNTQ